MSNVHRKIPRSKNTMPKYSIFLSVLLLAIESCLADVDNLQDICPTEISSSNTHAPFVINSLPCKNPADVNPSDFKSTGLDEAGDTDNDLRSSVEILTAAEFPGLNTLGLSIGRTDLELDGLVAAHSHPRAAEMMFVDKGVVTLGFVDTSNTRFQKVLREGDVFIVPVGLQHYCFNTGSESATIFSVLNSQNPGISTVGAGSN